MFLRMYVDRDNDNYDHFDVWHVGGCVRQSVGMPPTQNADFWYWQPETFDNFVYRWRVDPIVTDTDIHCD